MRRVWNSWSCRAIDRSARVLQYLVFGERPFRIFLLSLWPLLSDFVTSGGRGKQSACSPKEFSSCRNCFCVNHIGSGAIQ